MDADNILNSQHYGLFLQMDFSYTFTFHLSLIDTY